jgi:hypothetical protein
VFSSEEEGRRFGDSVFLPIMMERRVPEKSLGNERKRLLERLNRIRMKIRAVEKCVEDPSVASLYLSLTGYREAGSRKLIC